MARNGKRSRQTAASAFLPILHVAPEFESVPSTGVNNVDEPTLFSLKKQVLVLLETGRSTRDLLHPKMIVLKVVK